MPVPGIDPSAIEIDIEGRELRVRAEQRLTLPDDVDTEKVGATYHLGVLELTLPVKDSARPRRIPVQVAPETKRLQAA